MEMINIDNETGLRAKKHGYNGLFGTPDNVWDFIKLMLSGMPDKSGTITLAQGIINHYSLRCMELEDEIDKALSKLAEYEGGLNAIQRMEGAEK